MSLSVALARPEQPAAAPRGTVAPLLALLEAMPMAAMVLNPTSLVVLAANADAAALLGSELAELGPHWDAILRTPSVRQALLAGFASTSAQVVEVALSRPDGQLLELELRVRGTVLDGEQWLMVTLRDNGRCCQAEQAQVLLRRELDHRVKNLFAVIAGLVTFTARGTPSPQEMRNTLLGRIDALARAHDLVKLAIGGGPPAEAATRHHTSLAALAEALLSPFRTTAEPLRLRLHGEDLGIGALSAPPLALILHELATNAARHGALAHAGGALSLRWQQQPQAGLLNLTWEEHVGPGAAAPVVAASPGIGQRLVAQSSQQLGGSAGFKWRPEGLLVELALPLARLGL